MFARFYSALLRRPAAPSPVPVPEPRLILTSYADVLKDMEHQARAHQICGQHDAAAQWEQVRQQLMLLTWSSL